ncbi:aminoglycoside phosphotransferase [Bacillus sp. LL01]|uniref:phosphotransferase family protein n=1 Tax=Bacillus sp. LL01 TaxID=1665556 RepID=UPI00064D58AC|nr:aminoglycoside phosphotransferase family protein [Bacillus sp. LL01]KMJ57436.1 aminoglycoside phosphotransferase [Bacillus sp. LL01]
MNLGEPIASGNTANIFLYENKVIKIFKNHLPDSESTYEAGKQKFAYASGLRVPKILDVTKVNGKQAIIMEYVKGQTLGDLVSEDMDRLEYYLEISVDIQMAIHKVRADSFESMSVKLQRQINSVPCLDEQVKSSLLQRLGSMDFDDMLCHGDFHLYNLIKSDEEVTIIDWVDASAGVPRADVCRTYLLYSQVSMDIADLYLILYCKKSGVAREEILEWAPMIAAARLSENVATESQDKLMEIINQHQNS